MNKILKSVIASVLCLNTAFAACAPAAAAAEGEAGRYNFVFVCPNKEHEYWATIIEGMHKADERLGTATEVIGPDSYDNWSENLVKNMRAVLDREDKPDGIIVRGGVSGMADLINEAVQMGIPVITADTDESNSMRAAYIGSDYADIGRKAAQAIVTQIPENSAVGMVMTSEDPEDSGFGIRRAFEGIVNDYGIEIADTAYLVTNNLEDPVKNAEKQEADTVAAIKNMLEKNPDIKALLTTGAVNGSYAAKAKEELGRDGLIIVGQDDIEENIEYVKKGTIYAICAQRTNLIGYLSVVNLKKYIDTGSLPKTIYDTGVTLVTADNADTYANLDSILKSASATVRVGYYDDNEPEFQDGFSDGAKKSGYAYDYYQMLARFTGWKYEYVYGSKEEIRKKLINGDVDIMAGAYKTNSSFAAQVSFSESDMGLDDGRYFAVKSSNAELLDDLNYAMSQIDTVFPAFTIELYQKYFNQSSLSDLNEREEQWLLQKNTLTFGYTRNHLPFSGQDENGEPIGLAGELMRSIEEFANIEVVPVCFDYVDDMEKALKDNTIDVGFPMYSDLWIAESKGLHQTEAVVSDRMMIIYHGEYTSNITENIAISKMSLGLKEYFASNYPTAKLTEYETFDAMIDAVRTGKEKCVIGYSSILQHILSGYDNTDGLNISYLDKTAGLCMSVNQDNAVLAVILDKTINQINSEVITGTLLQYASTDRTVQPTLMDFFKQYAYLIVIVLIVFFAIIALAFALYIKKSRAYAKEQEQMQESLKKALDMADSANKAKTNFLSSMSHDIRTPMNAIVGMTDIAKKHTDDKEKLEDCLNKITLSSQHLLTLINDVLDISKIESGRLTLNPVNFSLRKTMDNLVNIVRPMIKSKKQEFDVHIHDVNCETLYGDELRISQVFINILSNAVKYTPEGGKIILDLHEERIDEKTVRLTYIVQDNGIGMSREYMEHMYDTFTRADDSRTNKVQGTGLGLAIVKQMVMLMNGTIECESEPDKGTVFTVELELPIGENVNRVYTLPPIDILFVDDDEVFLTITEDTVREMGANVETAHCGETAIELVKKRRESGNDYAVAIVDWKMPGMGGAEIVRAIRSIAGTGTSIILVSAYDWSDIEDDAKNSGADGFLSKPLFKSYLSEKIGLAINKGEEKSEAAENKVSDLAGLHVLVAEDNDLNWEVISELLKMQGITADHAENGQEAVSAMQNAAEGKYGLILMDVQMPVMNGREATAEIRRASRSYVKNIPIIAMTADAFAEDIAACLDAGMDGHVAKPVDMDKLCQEIKRVLSTRSKK
ncbi:MAG: response regulator [Firmicutes bacterium]|nr:response regulator [[Eubacterium] siraeum]MCM1488837.1 response regulator [Bacillota bacterium]